MNWEKWTAISIIAVCSLFMINNIGRGTRPIKHSVAIVSLIINTFLIIMVIYA